MALRLGRQKEGRMGQRCRKKRGALRIEEGHTSSRI